MCLYTIYRPSRVDTLKTLFRLSESLAVYAPYHNKTGVILNICTSISELFVTGGLLINTNMIMSC